MGKLRPGGHCRASKGRGRDAPGRASLETQGWRRGPRSLTNPTSAQDCPARPAYRVERQVDVSPQPPVVHQLLPVVTDPGGEGEPAVRTTPAPRGPDVHLLVRPPPGPSFPQGAAAPGDSDPIPDREVGEDLQQDRVGQVGKSRHDPVDTHFRFRLKELGDSPCGSPKKRRGERVRTGRWSQLPVAGGVSAFLLRGCGWTWEPDQHGIRTLHRGLGRGLGPSPGGVAKTMTNPGRG